MYHRKEMESGDEWRPELAIAGLLPYQAVVAEGNVLLKGSRYKGFIHQNISRGQDRFIPIG
jgi:hypothetical protein